MACLAPYSAFRLPIVLALALSLAACASGPRTQGRTYDRGSILFSAERTTTHRDGDDLLTARLELGFAAARRPALRGQRVGVFVSGGNVDMPRFAALVSG